MARGQPDFGMYQQKTVGATLSDMADLAVRLGSVVEYDRRGDVVFLDDFEDTILKWIITVGANDYFILDSTHVKSGSQALKVHVGTIGAFLPIMRKSFAALGSRSIGLEYSFCKPFDGLIIDCRINQVRGNIHHYGQMAIDYDRGQLVIRTPAGWTYIVESGLTIPVGNHIYTPTKLVVDLEESKYVRLLVANTEYDLSSYDTIKTTYETPDVDFVEIFPYIYAEHVAGDFWIDNVIVTENEP